MTLLVRDEEDILRDNLDFHLAQGVDFFVVTDNASVDGTTAIIDEYVRAGLAEKILEPADDYSQGCWVTRMARRAATVHGADWIINNDADEFWWAPQGGLRHQLARQADDCQALQVRRYNHPPLLGVGGADVLAAMVYRERRSFNALGEPLPRKVCHRAFSDLEVWQGNHAVNVNGVMLQPWPSSAITISHFPLRGYTGFERKIAMGGAAYARNCRLDPSVGATWRFLYDLWGQGALRAWYDEQVLSESQVDQRLVDGALTIDDTVPRLIEMHRSYRDGLTRRDHLLR